MGCPTAVPWAPGDPRAAALTLPWVPALSCPALLGLPWAEPWQQVLTLRQDPKNHTLGLAAST